MANGLTINNLPDNPESGNIIVNEPERVSANIFASIPDAVYAVVVGP